MVCRLNEQLVLTIIYHPLFLGDVCDITSATADRSTRGAFELTADAPGFMKGGLRTADSKYPEIKRIDERIDGIRRLQEVVGLYLTRRNCH